MPTRIEITSRSNPRLKQLLAGRDTRFFFAGEKLVRDILARGVAVDVLIVDAALEKERAGDPALVRELWLVSSPVLEKVSGLKTPPPLVAVIDLPPQEIDFSSQRLTVGLVDVQDPGNLGTVFRCASAFGIPALALAGACARPNNPKVVRAAQTAILDVPFQFFPDVDELVAAADNRGAHIYVTGSHAVAKQLDPGKMEFPCLVLFGNEGQGLDQRLLQRFPQVRLQQKEGIDSLNVGVSSCILMHELMRLHGL